jgi:hypothetical protein
MPRSKVSRYVQIARRLGFLNDDQVPQAEAVVEEAELSDLNTTGDLIVKAGILSEEAAEQVEEERRREDITGHRIDTLKMAAQATETSKTSSTHLSEVAKAIAAKAALKTG